MMILTSCTEEFDIKNPSKFNKEIEARTDIKTPEQLISIYYNYPPNEDIPKLEINSKELKNGFIEITLIHDQQQDDSQRAIKIVMLTKRNGKKWVVFEIKKNRKCYDGRGHTNWGTELCS